MNGSHFEQRKTTEGLAIYWKIWFISIIKLESEQKKIQLIFGKRKVDKDNVRKSDSRKQSL